MVELRTLGWECSEINELFCATNGDKHPERSAWMTEVQLMEFQREV